MNEWIERNQGYIIVFLLNLALNGALILLFLRPRVNEIKVVPVTPTPPRTTVSVFVSGCVATPDVYELPVNSLVKDAVGVAGGPASEADLDQINLARRLKDQEQVWVPCRATELHPSGGLEFVPSATPGRINLNTATALDLETLPGIGPHLAQCIIEYRAEHGSFSSSEEIKRVSGIADATYERIRDSIMVN